MPTLLTYPFDPTGQAVSNIITGEQHAVQEANYRDYYYIVPTYAPLFENNVVITYTSVGGAQRILVPDVDYYFALPFLGATRSIGVPLFGAIAFNNSIIDGTITINYRTLGGDWTTDPATVLQNLATLMYNPRIALWDVVTDKPAIFPPINHLQNIDTVYGAQALIDALTLISNTIAASSGTTIVIGNGQGGGVVTSDTYSIESDIDVVSNGNTVIFNVACQGAGVPNILYYTITHWTSSLINVSQQSGSINLTTANGIKTGTIALQCNNTNNTPVAFSIALRKTDINGDIVAFSDVITINNGDVNVIAKSGVMNVANANKNGFIFTNEQNTGLANPALKVLSMVVAGRSILTVDETLSYRAMYFGPNNSYRMIWEDGGDIKVLDDNNNVIFSVNSVASKLYVDNLLLNYATLANLNTAIANSIIPKGKLFFFSGM